MGSSNTNDAGDYRADCDQALFRPSILGALPNESARAIGKLFIEIASQKISSMLSIAIGQEGSDALADSLTNGRRFPDFFLLLVAFPVSVRFLLLYV